MEQIESDNLPPLGETIKKIRTEKRISFDTLAKETGFSIDFLMKIENGETVLSIGNLLKISRAIGVESGFLFQEKGAKRNNRITAHTRRTDNYAYETLSPGTENKHLKAFKVSIEGNTEHKGVSNQHIGEEFIYVLSGSVEVVIGDYATIVNQGESLHFNSGIHHTMRNISETRTEFIAILYTP
ncbi:HTH domain-containing protein, Cro/C1-type [Desulfonema limicola]|uniref:HTH domain-containing protein, Cro/C1-type n=1 Tax=Desulfonema limicola TaxID=45656 RepID=A0A975BCP1_9BACT|nr:cupin domain-containing protein [Desulfonema limicola]QTA83047.1 HTH domain-containing protein, Cro/C1-type [Desulfonema limicola]